jgi:hypothetical protein
MRRLGSPDRPGIEVLALGVLCFLGIVFTAGAAGAHATNPTSSPTTSSTSQNSGQHSLSQLSPGLEFLGGTITGNGPQAGRKLDSGQATAFVQAWLPDSVFGSPPFENPPATLPVYQVEVDYKYLRTLGSMTINYASDGTSAWVSMPPQSLWPGVVVTQERWIKAPDRTVAGFEGRLTPQTVPTVPTTSQSLAASPTSNGSSSTTLLLVIAGSVVLVAGIAILGIRRRAAHSTQSRTK